MAREKHIRRIGVLTAGGDCPGLNAVIRAVTKTAILQYGMEVIGIKDGYLGLIQDRTTRLTYEDVSNILTAGGTILGTSNKADPFQYYQTRGNTPLDVSSQALKTIRRLGLEALVCVGGDGTLTIAQELAQRGVKLVGIPKTIDNDVAETDVSFGFDSAMTTATEAIDKLHTTAQSHHRVMLIEVMGRNAGWLALHAGVAGGGDIILIPEIPFSLERICARVLERNRRGKRFSLVVVAEGARARHGRTVIRTIVPDSPERARLGGIAALLGADIEQCTGLETRVTVLGHLQRGGTPTPFDRVLATRYGTEAIRALARGVFGKMVALRGQRLTTVDLRLVTGRQRKVPRSHPLISSARAIGTSFGD
jgi:6-phosphofructokinase 1